MKNLRLLLLLPLILFSCKKGSNPSKTPPTPTPGSADKVTRTIRLDSDYYPTKYVYEEYRYNDTGMVTRYIKYEVDSGTHPVHKDTIQVITFDYAYGDTSRRPGYALENYRTSLYHLANAAHQYFYDKQGRLVLDTLIAFYQYNSSYPSTDRGVVISRRISYSASSITVTNINLDTKTGVKGSYNDFIELDGNGNPVNVSTLNGRDFVTGDQDNYNVAGFAANGYAYGPLSNSLHKMNVSNIMAFVQTGFPGGSFYASYLAKNAFVNSKSSAPGIVNSIITNFQFTTDASNKTLIRKVSFSRPGENEHGGYESFIYDTPF